MTPRAGRGLLSLVAVSPEIKPTRPGSSSEYTGVRSICAGRAVIRLLGLRARRRPGAAGATSAEAEGRAWVHILKLLPARRSRSRGWL